MRKSLFPSIAAQVALACSAASALMYEVVATEVLLFYHVQSSYSVSTVLAVFLAGLGIGSYLVYLFQRYINRPVLFFAIAQLVVALYGAFFFRHIVSFATTLSDTHLLVSSILVLGIPSLLFGASFPLAARMLQQKERDTTGLVYAADIAGAVIGALLAGFILVPHLGYSNTVCVAIGLNLLALILLASIALPRFRTRILFVSLAILGIGALTLVPFQRDYAWKQTLEQTGSTAIASPFGEVRVENKVLAINGKVQCEYDAKEGITEITMAHTVLEALGKDDAEILSIGLGCGGTTAALAAMSRVDVTVVEINPVIIELARSYTSLLEQPNVHAVIENGFSFLADTDRLYDAIVIDVEEPAAAHASALYTREAVARAAEHTTPQGILALWSYDGYTGGLAEYQDVVYFTLKSSFPYVYHQEGFFLASKQPIAQFEDYVPTTNQVVNTLENNVLTHIYLSNLRISG